MAPPDTSSARETAGIPRCVHVQPRIVYVTQILKRSRREARFSTFLLFASRRLRQKDVDVRSREMSRSTPMTPIRGSLFDVLGLSVRLASCVPGHSRDMSQSIRQLKCQSLLICGSLFDVLGLSVGSLEALHSNVNSKLASRRLSALDLRLAFGVVRLSERSVG